MRATRITTDHAYMHTPERLGFALMTERGYEVYPVRSYQLDPHRAGGVLRNLICERPNGEAVCFAQPFGTRAGMVDDCIPIGFVDIE